MHRTDANNMSPRRAALSAPLTLGLARAIARRWLLVRALHGCTLGLALGCLAALLLVIVSRALGPSEWATWAVASLALLGGATGLALALLRRPSLVSAAAAADVHAGQKDTLTSGLLLSLPGREHEDVGFTGLTIARAEGVAGSVSASAVAPIRIRAVWVTWLPALGLALAMASIMPPWGPARVVARTQVAAADPRAVERAQQSIDELARAIEAQRAAMEQGPQTDPQISERLERQLDRLREIEEELSAGLSDPQRAASDAAAAATRAAEALEEQAQRQLLADDALREALANMERQAAADGDALQGEELSDLAERLAEALQRGDLDRAAHEAQSLMDRARDPTVEEAERRNAAERLRDLAEQLEGAARQQDEPAGATTDQETEEGGPTPPTGTPEQAPSPAEQPIADPESPEPAGPGPEGQSSASEPRTAEDPQEAARREARRQQRELGEAMREAADEVERGPTREQQPAEADGRSEQEEGTKEQQTSEPGREPGQQQGQEPGQEQGRDPGQPVRDPAQTPTQDPGTPDPDKPAAQQQAQDPESGDETPGVREEGTEQGQEGQEPSATEQPRQRLADRLRQLADRPGQAQEQRDRAEELRERAREAFEQMSPQEQRELLERLREQGGPPEGQMERQPAGQEERPLQPTPLAGEPGEPGEAGEGPPAPGTPPRSVDPWEQELMDLARREQPTPDELMRTVAEWFGPGRAGQEQGPSPAEEARRAARGAQEAIERERVPARRSELIRRVFERYADRLGNEGGSG